MRQAAFRSSWHSRWNQRIFTAMKVGDVTCPECDAGFRRIELSSRMGAPSEYRCPVCNTLIEVLDVSKEVTYRLTVISMSRSVENGADAMWKSTET